MLLLCGGGGGGVVAVVGGGHHCRHHQFVLFFVGVAAARLLADRESCCYICSIAMDWALSLERWILGLGGGGCVASTMRS